MIKHLLSAAFYLILIPSQAQVLQLRTLTEAEKEKNRESLELFQWNIKINNSVAEAIRKDNGLSEDLSEAIAGGTGVGNGGDFILCPGRSPKFLDYYIATKFENVLHQPMAQGLWLLRKIDSLTALQEIGEIFNRVAPHIGDKFKQFTSSYLSHYRDIAPSKNYLWIRDSENLLLTKNIKDENLEFSIDPACSIKQLFVRVENPIKLTGHPSFAKNIILFNPSLMNQLSWEDTQLSFALTHEFLWNFIRRDMKGEIKSLDSRVVRGLNYFLHSHTARQLSPLALKEKLQNLGFRTPNSPTQPFDLENYLQGNYYEKYVALNLTTQEDIAFIAALIKLDFAQDNMSLIHLTLMERGIFLGIKFLNLKVLSTLIDLINFKDGLSDFERIALQIISYEGPNDYYRAINSDKKILMFIKDLDLHREELFSSGASQWEILGVFMRLSNLRFHIMKSSSQ